MVPPHQLFPCIDLLEHVAHRLNVVVVEEPYGWVLVIFLERHCSDFGVSNQALGMARAEKYRLTSKAVRHPYVLPIVLPQQDSHYSFARALG